MPLGLLEAEFNTFTAKLYSAQVVGKSTSLISDRDLQTSSAGVPSSSLSTDGTGRRLKQDSKAQGAAP